jgi:hypothetical protein
MSTSVQLFIEYLPELGRGSRRVVVDCPAARTECTIITPHNRDEALATAFLKAATIFRHEHEHPACDTGPLWASEGLDGVKTTIDAAWDGMVADALKELAN